MVNLFLNICQARACASRSASGLRMVELKDISHCSGFISQDLRDELCWAL